MRPTRRQRITWRLYGLPLSAMAAAQAWDELRSRGVDEMELRALFGRAYAASVAAAGAR